MNDERPLAIVSGAARGIGRACVEIFVAQGWQVGALDQDETVRTAFAQNERAIPLVANVTDPIALQAELDRLPSPAAALINAAGVFPPTSLSDFQIEQYRQVFDVNVLALLWQN